MTHPKPKAPRKPKPTNFGDHDFYLYIEQMPSQTEPWVVSPTWDSVFVNAREARRLAAWLLKFSDWADAKAKSTKEKR